MGDRLGSAVEAVHGCWLGCRWLGSWWLLSWAEEEDQRVMSAEEDPGVYIYGERGRKHRLGLSRGKK